MEPRRVFSFNTATDRTGLTTYGAAGDGTCQVNATASTSTWTYDTADRVNTAGYAYDALGRTKSLPASDTQASAGGDQTLDYYSNDMIQTLTQGGRTSTYTLDVVTNRTRSWNDTSAGAVKVNHYGDDGDKATWTDEGNNNMSRVIKGIGGIASVFTNTTGNVWTLANLHGDLIAGVLESGTGLAYTSEYTESGQARNASDVGSRRYGWLGSAQRQSDNPGGVILMGVRVYNPTTARFHQHRPDLRRQRQRIRLLLRGRRQLLGHQWHVQPLLRQLPQVLAYASRKLLHQWCQLQYSVRLGPRLVYYFRLSLGRDWCRRRGVDRLLRRCWGRSRRSRHRRHSGRRIRLVVRHLVSEKRWRPHRWDDLPALAQRIRTALALAMARVVLGSLPLITELVIAGVGTCPPGIGCGASGGEPGKGIRLIARGFFTAAVLVVELAGLVLCAYAVVGVGLRGLPPTPQSVWGSTAAMRRAVFAAYFGSMGLAWALSVHLFLFYRHERYFPLLVLIPALIFLLLAAGWLIARKR